MGFRKRDTYNLFIAIAVALLAVIVITLPGLAGVPGESLSAPSQSGTPTILVVEPSSSNSPQLTPPSTELIAQPTASIITLQATPSSTAGQADPYTYTPTTTLASSLLVNQLSFMPVVYQLLTTPTPPPAPPEPILFCDSLSQPLTIPDNDPNGVNNDIFVNDGRLLVNIRLYVDISHTWVGDLAINLSHQGTGQSITVINRPGTAPNYCSNNDIVTILDDNAALPGNNQCASSPHAISGIYLPLQAFETFSGQAISGTWRLNVSDHYQNDLGALNHWCLQATVADTMPIPTPPPTPISLPDTASVSGMSGYDQQLGLDCESRSAVDWARHYGVIIDELGFLNHLPFSDDPEVGFVGDPDGIWGYIPPNDYGVHAAPVAALLRQYGLVASAYHSLHWDDLRAELAAGNPAIVWIVGGYTHNLVNGTPHLYTAVSSGYTSVVAPYEHTVILVGYTPDTVTVLNGSRFVTLPLDQFLDSWSALDFMAVLARP